MQLKEAFIESIKENEGILFKISKIYGKDLEDQKDLYQEIVYQSWHSYANFKGKSKFSTWLYKVGLNTAISHLNQQKKKLGESGFDQDILQIIDEREQVLEERSALLYHSIKQLNEVDKGIIFLFLEGKNYEEIASITALSTSNVGTRLGRIKNKLKELMLKAQ